MPKEITQKTDCYKLDKILDYYNWDDGFELPYQIINHHNCELATALKAFYLAEGDQYLQNRISESKAQKESLDYLNCLYDKIVSGCYIGRFVGFKVPLTKVQKYKLLKAAPDTPAIFIEDITGSKTAKRCEQCLLSDLSDDIAFCMQCHTESLHISVDGLTFSQKCDNCGLTAATTCIRPCLVNDTTPREEFSKYDKCRFRV